MSNAASATALAEQPNSSQGTRQLPVELPDIQAAKRIPIDEVADRLGLDRQGGMIRCWRPENHQHGDRTPSVGIQLRKNRVKCFVCDAKRLSPVDLVQSVWGVETFDALRWLDAHFGPLPRIEKGKHLSHSSFAESRGRAGLNGRLEPLVRAGVLAELSDAEVRLLQVFDAFCDPSTNTCTLSYAALKRFAGIAKDKTISNALKRLRNIHAIEVQRGSLQRVLAGHIVSRCSTYMLTLEHSDFLRLLHACQSETREEIAMERKVRAERRARLRFCKNATF